MTRFALAQTFFVDRDIVNKANEIGITKISLFFKNKPKIEDNRSGIEAPGVEIFIAPTYFGVPVLNSPSTILGENGTIQLARKEYSSIAVSSTADTPTDFTFARPVRVQTNAEYAIIIRYDGDEEFDLWNSKQGDYLLGTTNISPGPSGKYIGKLYSYINMPLPGTANSTANVDIISVPNISDQEQLDQLSPDLDYLLSSWKPINDTDLKFEVYAARYSHGGLHIEANSSITDNNLIGIITANNITVLSNNVIRITAPAYPMEYVYYDKKNSSTDDVVFGDYVYAQRPYYPGGKATPATVSVVANNKICNCDNTYILADNTAFNFSKLYSGSLSEFIIVVSLNHNGANAHLVNVRQIRQVTNNTLIVNEPFSFTNAGAYFFKSPVARLYSKSRPYITGHTRDLVVLADSNANDSCRFVNGTISTVNVAAIGSGYANSDYVVITGFEAVTNEVLGGYAAYANIVTYANGSIANVFFSNTGAGFTNASLIVYQIANSSASNSVGSGANLQFTTNTVLYTQFQNQNNYFSGVTIMNFDSQQLLPSLKINNPMGTAYSIKYKSLYHSIASANTLGGRTWLVDSIADAAVELDVINEQLYHYPPSKRPAIVSRSNQFAIGYANGFIPNTSIAGTYYSNTAVFLIDAYSNNDFVSVSFKPNDLNSYYAKYNINNDYTRENTNYGNAYAKHVTTKVSFANGQFAEDLLVFLTAYRPQNTDIKVFARIHNSHDGDAFDDKDWTLLEQIDGLGVFSSLTNPSDRVELTYGFPLYPNTAVAANTTASPSNTGILAGVATTQLNNTTIVGVGTSFNTLLANNDLVKIYQPLFANADYVVAVVNTVVNSTVFTIKTPISNNSVVASGMKVAKISYPLQAFKNLTLDNVVRYYTSTKVEYDTYDTFQLKIVMLGIDDYVVPKVDDIKAVGATA